jgi:hypothetical protein
MDFPGTCDRGNRAHKPGARAILASGFIGEAAVHSIARFIQDTMTQFERRVWIKPTLLEVRGSQSEAASKPE